MIACKSQKTTQLLLSRHFRSGEGTVVLLYFYYSCINTLKLDTGLILFQLHPLKLRFSGSSVKFSDAPRTTFFIYVCKHIWKLIYSFFQKVRGGVYLMNTLYKINAIIPTQYLNTTTLGERERLLVVMCCVALLRATCQSAVNDGVCCIGGGSAPSVENAELLR